MRFSTAFTFIFFRSLLFIKLDVEKQCLRAVSIFQTRADCAVYLGVQEVGRHGLETCATPTEHVCEV